MEPRQLTTQPNNIFNLDINNSEEIELISHKKPKNTQDNLKGIERSPSPSPQIHKDSSKSLPKPSRCEYLTNLCTNFYNSTLENMTDQVGSFLQAFGTIGTILYPISFIFGDASDGAHIDYNEPLVYNINLEYTEGETVCESDIPGEFPLKEGKGFALSKLSYGNQIMGYALSKIIKNTGNFLQAYSKYHQIMRNVENAIIKAQKDYEANISNTQGNKNSLLHLSKILNLVDKASDLTIMMGLGIQTATHSWPGLTKFNGFNEVMLSDNQHTQFHNQNQDEVECFHHSYNDTFKGNLTSHVTGELLVPKSETKNITIDLARNICLITGYVAKGISKVAFNYLRSLFVSQIVHDNVLAALKSQEIIDTEAIASKITKELVEYNCINRSETSFYQKHIQKCLENNLNKQPTIDPLKSKPTSSETSTDKPILELFKSNMLFTDKLDFGKKVGDLLQDIGFKCMLMGYYARYTTDGIPKVSSGFNELTAGESTVTTISQLDVINNGTQKNSTYSQTNTTYNYAVPAAKMIDFQTDLFTILLSAGSGLFIAGNIIKQFAKEEQITQLANKATKQFSENILTIDTNNQGTIKKLSEYVSKFILDRLELETSPEFLTACTKFSSKLANRIENHLNQLIKKSSKPDQNICDILMRAIFASINDTLKYSSMMLLSLLPNGQFVQQMVKGGSVDFTDLGHIKGDFNATLVATPNEQRRNLQQFPPFTPPPTNSSLPCTGTGNLTIPGNFCNPSNDNSTITPINNSSTPSIPDLPPELHVFNFSKVIQSNFSQHFNLTNFEAPNISKTTLSLGIMGLGFGGVLGGVYIVTSTQYDKLTVTRAVGRGVLQAIEQQPKQQENPLISTEKNEEKTPEIKEINLSSSDNKNKPNDNVTINPLEEINELEKEINSNNQITLDIDEE